MVKLCRDCGTLLRTGEPHTASFCLVVRAAREVCTDSQATGEGYHTPAATRDRLVDALETLDTLTAQEARVLGIHLDREGWEEVAAA